MILRVLKKTFWNGGQPVAVGKTVELDDDLGQLALDAFPHNLEVVAEDKPKPATKPAAKKGDK